MCEAPLVSSVALLRLAAGPPSQPMLTSFFGAGEGLFYLSRLFFMLNTCSKCLFILSALSSYVSSAVAAKDGTAVVQALGEGGGRDDVNKREVR